MLERELTAADYWKGAADYWSGAADYWGEEKMPTRNHLLNTMNKI